MSIDHTPILGCRVCESQALVKVIDLGNQALTGVFPGSIRENVPTGPLELMWCQECSLVQLSTDYPASEMYGDNYGYRSGLNASMVEHLAQIAARLEVQVGGLNTESVILDIGSNDGTLLGLYSASGAKRIGIDPTADKFRKFYANDIRVVPDFFSREAFNAVSRRPADIITTISMFYDLPDPIGFSRQVRDCLAADGVWMLEQSYMPSMLRTTSYDTICHEHIEYYSLSTIQRILREAEMRVIDVRFNRVNGGSFAVTAVRNESRLEGKPELVQWFSAQESRMRFDTIEPFRDFEARVFQHRSDLRELIQTLVGAGNKVMGLGASTKGNVLLQFCGLGPDLISGIADVNPDKHGRVTPGTGIPIISEEEARSQNPDYFLVLPWHFREGIVQREYDFLRRGGGLIFPLPEIEIVGG